MAVFPNRISEINEDIELLNEAIARLSDPNTQYISTEELMKELGITQEDLDNAEVPEIE